MKSRSTADRSVSKVPEIGLRIAEVRGQRVLLDADLAALYEVETRRLNEAVKRNLARFPADFMCQLTAEEWGFEGRKLRS